MQAVGIRPYRPSDEPELLAVWNTAMAADPIDASTFRRMVLLDPNLRPEGLLVADDGTGVSGFCLAIHRRVPHFLDGVQAELGWLTAFGVRPSAQRRGIGQQLLRAALTYLGRQGARKVQVSPYVPNYFTPGIDIAAYPAAIRLLERHGFRVTSRPLSMRTELTGFRIPEAIGQTSATLAAAGLTVRPAEAGDLLPVLEFAASRFSWDWWQNAAEVVERLFGGGESRSVGMWVAYQGERLVGYSMHRAERFGPFGVDPEMRNRGIGRVLLAETLLGMRRQQYHAAWFLWTGDAAARLYAQCGFHEVRRFAVMEKILG